MMVMVMNCNRYTAYLPMDSMIHVDQLEWMVRGTGEGLSLDLDLQAAYHLTTWALPNERTDHSVCN